jgi:hypothetical protein
LHAQGDGEDELADAGAEAGEEGVEGLFWAGVSSGRSFLENWEDAGEG